MKEFITIQDNAQAEIVEKKSKFIANLIYVETVEEAEQAIKKIKKKYFDAKHNCIAYRIVENEQLIEKSSDDGEPSGTAGAPMLTILQKNNLVNVVVIVTRYFGGVLLGTGGLVRAYSDSLIKAISSSKLCKKCLGVEMEVVLEYSNYENFKYYCKNREISIVDVQYAEEIICKIELEEDKKRKLLEDFETKKVMIQNLKDLSQKYISRSI